MKTKGKKEKPVIQQFSIKRVFRQTENTAPISGSGKSEQIVRNKKILEKLDKYIFLP